MGDEGREGVLARETVKRGTVSGVGSVVGTVAWQVMKMVVALLMVLVFAVDLFWW